MEYPTRAELMALYHVSDAVEVCQCLDSMNHMHEAIANRDDLIRRMSDVLKDFYQGEMLSEAKELLGEV